MAGASSSGTLSTAPEPALSVSTRLASPTLVASSCARRSMRSRRSESCVSDEQPLQPPAAALPPLSTRRGTLRRPFVPTGDVVTDCVRANHSIAFAYPGKQHFMYLTTLTVCIAFEDYLLHTLPCNRGQCDRYFIVTDRASGPLRALARQHRL